MNIQKLLSQDPAKAVIKAIAAGVKLALMAGDLRTFANHVSARTIKDLEQYCYFKRFFNGGFAVGPDYNQASITGDTVHWSNGGIRTLHSQVLGLQHATGNSGTDLVSGKALARMHEKGLVGLDSETFPTEWHCEHTYPVKQINEDLIREVIEHSKRISAKEMARYAMMHALATTIHISERTHGGPTINENLRPFEKYNDGVLQYVDGKFIDITNATLQEVMYNRWQRNPYYREFYRLFEDLPDSNFEDVRQKVKHDLYYLTPGSDERRLIEMTTKNLDILARNDPMEIASKFCPDAFKDRWKKKAA